MSKVQLFSWEASGRGSDNIHLQANPTRTTLMSRKVDKEKDKLKEAARSSILDKYGGEHHLERPSEGLLTQNERYIEYSRTGKVIRGQERAVLKSKYEEDVFTNNHKGVWGSWWHEGRWGYKCCHQQLKNSYCTS